MVIFKSLIFLHFISFLFVYFHKYIAISLRLVSYLLNSPAWTWIYDLSCLIKEELTWSRHLLVVLFLHTIIITMKFQHKFWMKYSNSSSWLILFFKIHTWVLYFYHFLTPHSISCVTPLALKLMTSYLFIPSLPPSLHPSSNTLIMNVSLGMNIWD